MVMQKIVLNLLFTIKKVKKLIAQHIVDIRENLSLHIVQLTERLMPELTISR